MVDIIIIVVLLLLIAAAVRYLWKQHKNGCGCLGCRGCARRGDCPSARQKGDTK
ncbi:MAG: FeoB-associated Cys-rich membrane protein [Intestinibacillus sp.]